ncbi:MAG TPA: helix-turn-helix domain-containing protein [Solirubrobacterales bacterium]|nr:helix-turn-helix domain-containing protein [Solirubrobacterales bacterium]
MEEPQERLSTPPPAIVDQVKLAERSEVSLADVMRSYLAGYFQFNEWVIRECERSRTLESRELTDLLGRLSDCLDRVTETVTAEHRDSAQLRPRHSLQGDARSVRRMLAGSEQGQADLGYALNGYWHTGIVASGPDACSSIRSAVRTVDCQVLLTPQEDQLVWAWLGTREPGRLAVGPALLAGDWPAETAVAIGEPGHGLEGWRLTHRQACAALGQAERRPGLATPYGSVAVAVTLSKDETLRTFLQQHFLDVLKGTGDSIDDETTELLDCYLQTGCNASAAAAQLGMNRRTVSKRLRSIEEKLGHSIGTNYTELSLALTLHRQSRAECQIGNK